VQHTGTRKAFEIWVFVVQFHVLWYSNSDSLHNFANLII